MEQINVIFALFLMNLTLGLQFFLPMIRVKDLGLGFYKLVDGISLGAFFLFLIFNIKKLVLGQSFSMPLMVAMFISYFFINTFFNHKENQKLLHVFSFLKIFLLILFSTLFHSAFPLPFKYSLFDFFLNLGFVGAVTFAMVLGHYYLVVPKLSEQILFRVVKVIWIFWVIKILYSVWEIYGGWDQIHLSLFASLSDLWRTSDSEITNQWPLFDQMLFGMRFLWGHLILGILNYFNHRLVKMRSIQSATGILYVMVFFLIIGEMTSYYFFLKFGWNL